jgi:hypothetical protein
MDKLRKPLLIIAMFVALVIVLVDAGSATHIGVSGAEGFDGPKPGKGIPYLALIDGLIFYTTALLGTALIIPEAIQGRVQGVLSLIVGVVMLIVSFVLAIAALLLLLLMLMLLMAPPFGTIAYFALYSDFDTDTARIALGAIMTLKFIFVICLLFAHQRFLQNKGLVLIICCSLLANLIIGFLHGLVPGFLVSITDTLAAIIIAVIALIWAIFFIVGSIASIFRAIV